MGRRDDMHARLQRTRPRRIAEMRGDPLGVQLHPIEVVPDPRVVLAAVAPAHTRTMRIDTAAAASAEVGAAAVALMADEVRTPEIPSHMPSLDLVDTERKLEAAARGAADRQARLSVDRSAFGRFVRRRLGATPPRPERGTGT